MALVHPNSCKCMKSELDLFEVPPTQTSGLVGIGSRKDWHRLWRIKDLTNMPFVGQGTTWLILTCLWKHRSWMATILHWMAERKLDLSTYGCIPSLVMSVLASTNNWFHHRPACTLTELTYKHYSAMAQLPNNLNQLESCGKRIHRDIKIREQRIHVPESIDGPKQVCTDDGKTTLGLILSWEIFTESRQSENQITTKSRRVRPNGWCRQLSDQNQGSSLWEMYS